MREPMSMARRKRRWRLSLQVLGANESSTCHAISGWQEHHRGYIDWQTYEANQQRIAKNTRPGPHKAGGAVREGSALLQGLASCGHCGRRLRTHYRGRNSPPGYPRSGEHLVDGRGSYCLNIGGVQSTTPWHAPSLQRSSRRRSQRRWLLLSSWRWIARPRSSTGGSASSGRATWQASPSAAIAP